MKDLDALAEFADKQENRTYRIRTNVLYETLKRGERR